MSNELDFNLGHSTAYAYAKASGDLPEGMTPDEYGELLAAYATVGQTAVTAAQTATTKASEAATSATTATNKASEATTAAQTATTKAAEASTSASTATSAKDTAVSASQTATAKATEATTAAATAVTAKDDAVSANTAAQSAKTAAQTAQTGAETAAASVQSSAAQIATNTEDIGQLKNTLSDVKENLSDVESYLGYSKNYFDGRGLTTTNPTNWTISAAKTSVTITHNNSYSTGTPTLPLNIPAGEYVFHATHNTTNAFYLYIDGVYSSTIKDGSSLVIESGKTYMFEALNISSGLTQTITDISITSANVSSGVIQSIENDIDVIESAVNEISETVTITLSVEMESDTASTVATANGVESTGSNYHTVKFPVKGSDIAHVSIASTNWGNPYYIVCDSNNTVVAVSDRSPSSATITALHDLDVIIPTNGSYLIVNYVSTHSVTPTVSVSRETLVAKTVSYPFAGKKWVAIGDSLTEKNESASKNYVDWVCEKLGLTCVNMGVGGTGYMRGYDTNKAFYQRVSNIPSDADIITVFGSGNDLGLYNQIGTPSDTGTSTICGCINTTLDYIANNFPTVPVVVIAPTIWKDQVPTENTPMTYYVQFLEEIARKRSLHFLNLYSSGGLNPNNAVQLNALFYHQTLDGNADGVHPNNAGHKIIAPKIKNAIECALI